MPGWWSHHNTSPWAMGLNSLLAAGFLGPRGGTCTMTNTWGAFTWGLESYSFYILGVLEKGRTRHQQNVAPWIIDCCSAVGGLAVSFNCWDCIFRQRWSYDIFLTRFSAIKQFSWHFKKFFHKINTPLHRYTLLYTCWYIYTHMHTDQFTHIHASIFTTVLTKEIFFHITLKLFLC